MQQLNLNGRVISDFLRDPLHEEVLLRAPGSMLTSSRYNRSGRIS
ncbi:hypothetical protein [Pseudomonas sp. RL_5y_Pfl2_73]